VFTPAEVNLHDGNLFLDLNCGPRNQFWFGNEVSTFATRSAVVEIRRLAIYGSSNASVLVDDHGPAELPSNAVVGPGGSFKNVHHQRQLLADAWWRGFFSITASNSGVGGNWANRKVGYLGLKFDIRGETHYGFATLQVKPSVDYRGGANPRVNGALLGYAYDATPDQPIVTGQRSGAGMTSESASPQPGTLGALAMGSAGPGRCPNIRP
jgi:hypothetical protein